MDGKAKACDGRQTWPWWALAENVHEGYSRGPWTGSGKWGRACQAWPVKEGMREGQTKRQEPVGQLRGEERMIWVEPHTWTSRQVCMAMKVVWSRVDGRRVHPWQTLSKGSQSGTDFERLMDRHVGSSSLLLVMGVSLMWLLAWRYLPGW